jgi:hypothetical protein
MTMMTITRWRLRHIAATCDDGYLTSEGHLMEAERLAWVIDEEIQSGGRRTLGDLIALARLHLDLARALGEPEVMPP